jgi:CheY-like chemotaxis protein
MAGRPGERRILVVEDEPMIRMLINDMVTELGYTVVAEAGRLEDALRAASSAEIDVAILDVDLAGEAIAPVAAVLAARGMPFVFVTGYGEPGLPESYRDRPILKKPFQIESLKRTLETARARANNE